MSQDARMHDTAIMSGGHVYSRIFSGISTRSSHPIQAVRFVMTRSTSFSRNTYVATAKYKDIPIATVYIEFHSDPKTIGSYKTDIESDRYYMLHVAQYYNFFQKAGTSAGELEPIIAEQLKGIGFSLLYATLRYIVRDLSLDPDTNIFLEASGRLKNDSRFPHHVLDLSGLVNYYKSIGFHVLTSTYEAKRLEFDGRQFVLDPTGEQEINRALAVRYPGIQLGAVPMMGTIGEVISNRSKSRFNLDFS